MPFHVAVVALQLEKRIDVFLAVFVFKKYFDKVFCFPQSGFLFLRTKKKKKRKICKYELLKTIFLRNITKWTIKPLGYVWLTGYYRIS